MEYTFENRNWNLDAISLHLAEEIASLGKSGRVNELLACSFGRVIKNEFKRGTLTPDQLNSYFLMHLEHISDWIEAAVNNGDEWLSNIDEHGRPKKLLKFSNVMQIVQEANRDMALFAEKHRNVVLIEGDEEIVERFDNGYHLVRLLTPNALDRESGQMQHCIGQGAYDDYLDGDEYEYFSLRDPFGKPHVTIEIGVNRIAGMRELIQFQGKQNQPPVAKYQEMMIPYFRKQKIQILQASPSLPFITDIHGQWFSIYDLPETLEVKVFSYTDYEVFEKNLDVMSLKPIRLPKNLVGTHRLNICGACLTGSLETFPETMSYIVNDVHFVDKQSNITTKGDININSTKFSTPPNSIKGNSVTILSCEPNSVPENIESETYLSIRCREALSNPFTKKIKANCNSLSIVNVNFGGVAHELCVRSNTRITAYNIDELPKGLRTNNLYLYGVNNFIDLCDIAPDHPIVSGFISLEDIEIGLPDDYPDDVIIKNMGRMTTVKEIRDEMKFQNSELINSL